jgi:hypothetical protein
MERTICAVKMRYRRISVRKNWNRFRFRHLPLDYLADLEAQWEQAEST